MILVALAVVAIVVGAVAVSVLTSLLRDHGDAPRERLFGDTMTTAVVVGGVGLAVVVVLLAVLVMGVVGLRS